MNKIYILVNKKKIENIHTRSSKTLITCILAALTSSERPAIRTCGSKGI